MIAPRRDRPGALAIASVVSWLVVLIAWFFVNVLWSFLWIGAFLAIVALAFTSGALTLAWSLRLSFRRRFVLSVMVLLPATAVGFVALAVPWEEVYSRVWFGLHRDAFVRAEALVRSGELDLSVDMYGAELPSDLRSISILGRLSATTPWSGEDEKATPCDAPIEFAPAAVGIPDGGVGFVHLPCDMPPPGFMVNGFDDAIAPRIRLGDGWWWADGRVP